MNRRIRAVVVGAFGTAASVVAVGHKSVVASGSGDLVRRGAVGASAHFVETASDALFGLTSDSGELGNGRLSLQDLPSADEMSMLQRVLNTVSTSEHGILIADPVAVTGMDA